MRVDHSGEQWTVSLMQKLKQSWLFAPELRRVVITLWQSQGQTNPDQSESQSVSQWTAGSPGQAGLQDVGLLRHLIHCQLFIGKL